MSFGVKDAGEEFTMRLLHENDLQRPSTAYMSMYNDRTDQLNDVNNLGAITTEPAGSNYERQPIKFGSEMNIGVDSDSNWYVNLGDATFDVSDSSQTVDGVFVTVNYQRYGESKAKDQLYFASPLNNKTDLSQVNGTMTIDGVGYEFD